jgi:hypothetical protein
MWTPEDEPASQALRDSDNRGLSWGAGRLVSKVRSGRGKRDRKEAWWEAPTCSWWVTRALCSHLTVRSGVIVQEGVRSLVSDLQSLNVKGFVQT